MGSRVLLLLLGASLVLNVYFIVIRYQGAKVERIIDGDTFELADGRRIRLMGVDAPETGRCMSDEAKHELSRLVLGRHIRMKNAIMDDYGRLVANVIIEDWDSWSKYIIWKLFPKGSFPDPMVNRSLARSGLVRVVSSSGEYKKTITDAANDAKQEKLGIYSDQCRMPSGGANCTIKGNIRQGKKQYYLPACKTYQQVIVDTSFGDQWFCSESDAISSGFTLSMTCH